jgi:hypothetical protein
MPEDHPSARRPHPSGDDVEQGRLARPVGPEHRDHLATLDREVYAAERLDGAVPLVGTDERDYRNVWRSGRPGVVIP